MIRIIITVCLFVVGCGNTAQEVHEPILPGAYQMDQYIKYLEGKRVALTVNHSSEVRGTHLTDTLVALGVRVDKVFTPEHGFKGTASDGASIDYDSSLQQFELISLYGKNKKPTHEQMQGIDVMVFDIQDVGTRFYTYISTMHYVMEACAENDIQMLVLDRPNPNGSYVDGPVMDTTYRSFVGMHPIPIVHGMTVGELARMINEEGWLFDQVQCDLTVIPVKNWDHSTPYSLPLSPSPNLPNDLSISLYPSLCLFEGTIMSVGRGTDYPFQVIGHPEYPDTTFSFIPKAWEGSRWPPYENQICYGISWTGESTSYEFSLQPLIHAYQQMISKDFFNDYFIKLEGTGKLQKQIESGMSEEEIRKTWEAPLQEFAQLRSNYLLYK